MKNIHLTIFISIILILALITPMAVHATTISGLTIDEAVDVIRQELNQDRTDLKKELESLGYEVSETNLDRYIDEFLIEYRKAIIYLQSHQERIYAEIQKEIDAGAGQHQIDIVHDRMVEALFKESGFNPEAIAAKIFPKRSIIAPAPATDTPQPETRPDTVKEEVIQTPAPAPAPETEEPPAADEPQPQPVEEPPAAAETDWQEVYSNVPFYMRPQQLQEKEPEAEELFSPGAKNFFTRTGGTIARTADLFSKIPVVNKVTSAIGIFTDTIENVVVVGDNVITGSLKSFTGNFVYGLTSIPVSIAELANYSFDGPFSPQDVVKGLNNYFVDALFGVDGEELKKRNDSGHYGEIFISRTGYRYGPEGQIEVYDSERQRYYDPSRPRDEQDDPRDYLPEYMR